MLTFWFENNTNILALGNPSTYGPAHRPKCEGVNLLLSSDGILIRDSGEDERTLVGEKAGWVWSRGLGPHPAEQQAKSEGIGGGRRSQSWP